MRRCWKRLTKSGFLESLDEPPHVASAGLERVADHSLGERSTRFASFRQAVQVESHDRDVLRRENRVIPRVGAMQLIVNPVLACLVLEPGIQADHRHLPNVADLYATVVLRAGNPQDMRPNHDARARADPPLPVVDDAQHDARHARHYADDDPDGLESTHTQCCMINALALSRKARGELSRGFLAFFGESPHFASAGLERVADEGAGEGPAQPSSFGQAFQGELQQRAVLRLDLAHPRVATNRLGGRDEALVALPPSAQELEDCGDPLPPKQGELRGELKVSGTFSRIARGIEGVRYIFTNRGGDAAVDGVGLQP